MTYKYIQYWKMKAYVVSQRYKFENSAIHEEVDKLISLTKGKKITTLLYQIFRKIKIVCVTNPITTSHPI